jgi:hypothetical protein
MEILFGIYWSIAFTVIIFFLGGLTYYIQRQILTDKFLLATMYQQQGHRSSGSNRRRNARNANRNRQQQQTTANMSFNNTDVKEKQEQDDEEKTIVPETTAEEGQQAVLESSVKQTDDRFEETIQTKQTTSPLTHINNEQIPVSVAKQNNNNKTTLSPSREESVLPSKPQASVAPVKQISPLPLMKNVSSNNFKPYIQQENYPKSNGNTASNNMYTYSGHNPLPPRFQQQRQKEAAAAAQNSHRRKGPLPSERSTIPPGSAARPNDFIPSLIPQQQTNDDDNNNNNQLESPVSLDQQELLVNHDYSSESDILSGNIDYFTMGKTDFTSIRAYLNLRLA